MLPQAPNGHSTTGGDMTRETDISTILNVEGNTFLSCESVACHEAEVSRNTFLMELGILVQLQPHFSRVVRG